LPGLRKFSKIRKSLLFNKLSYRGTGLAGLLTYSMTNVKKMKRFTKPVLLFVCSFALGVCIAPTYKMEKEPVSEPVQKPVQHYLNRYGEKIKRTV